MKHLRYLNKFFIKYRWHLLGGIAFVFISNYFRVLQPVMIREALDLVVENIGLFSLYDGFPLQKELYIILDLLFAPINLLYVAK